LAFDATSGDLVLTYDFSDPEGDPDLSELRWYQNDTLVETYNDLKTVNASSLVEYDEWHVQISPYDGIDYGSLIISNKITIPPGDGDGKGIPGFPVYVLLSFAAITLIFSVRKFKK
jgi:hypothetical protein